MKNGKISTETAIQALSYQGPVFIRHNSLIAKEHEDYPALSRIIKEVFDK